MDSVKSGEKLPRVVVIGGGTGLSVMLGGLKNKPLDITAIVTVADDGGSSGILRNEMQIPPPGDIRNVLVALADVEPLMEKVLQYRFPAGVGLAGHSLGNLILAAMNDITGDFVTGVKEMSRVFAVRGRVYPSAADAFVLKAEMTDGSIVEGESQIPLAGKRIRRVFIDENVVRPLEEALEAIAEADAIVIGPGSLYTSVIPNLIVPKIADAIRSSDAVKMYICNVMTQPGETDQYAVSDHIKAIHDHVGFQLFDYVLVNNGMIPKDILDKYEVKGSYPVLLDEERVHKLGYQIIADHLFYYGTYLRHDRLKLSDLIFELVEQGGASREAGR